jgi:hypothetical protein
MSEIRSYSVTMPLKSSNLLAHARLCYPSQCQRNSLPITMEIMLHRSTRLSILLVSLAFLGSSLALSAQDDSSQHMRKYKPPPQSARIHVTVLRDFNGKPIEDAHVIFHPIEGDKDKGYLELKTDEDGKVLIDVLPIGDTVRMQVIANGYQTYGQDYKVDKSEMSMEIRMKRPGKQYSIYNNNSSGTPNGSSDKSTPPAQNAAPPASGDKPSGSDNPPQSH